MTKMGKHKHNFNSEPLKETNVTAFGYELLRQVSLPDLLGEDSSFMQYYMGKTLARKFPLNSMEEITSFFQDASFGTLQLVKEKKNEFTFQLTSPLITERFQYAEPVNYRLEAGFLAETFTNLYNEQFECLDEQNKKKKCIIFHVVGSI